jgi:hypothetical protein
VFRKLVVRLWGISVGKKVGSGARQQGAGGGDTAWSWVAIGEHGGAAGNWTDVFRGKASLSVEDLLVREVIQNSWDAANRFRDELRERGAKEPPFRMRFRFVEIDGAERDAFVAATGIAELEGRYREHPDKFNGLDGTFFADLKWGKPLQLLFIEDYGTHGLFGPPSAKTNSHLFRALYFAGSPTAGAKKAGGSFGFGKSAFIRSSGIQTVLAHTAFEPHPELDDAVTERLIGFAWWAPHDSEGNPLEGRAMFGRGPRSEPYEDDEARGLARVLGFRERQGHEAGPNELGTSLLILGPTVDPRRLRASMETHWWPAIVDDLMDLRVITKDGEELFPKPRSNGHLKSFLRAYEIATGMVSIPGKNEKRVADGWRQNQNIPHGSLGLVVEESSTRSASQEDDDAPGPGSGGAVVATMRNTRMVIEYRNYSVKHVPIRGVYVASDEESEYLRATEPVTHDAWSTQTSKDIPAEATALAKTVYGRLTRAINELAKQFEPEEQPTTRALKHFTGLMQRFVGSRPGGERGESKPGEPIEMQYSSPPSMRAVGEDEIEVGAEIRVALGERAKVAEGVIAVGCDARISEDEGSLGDAIPVTLEPESGKEQHIVGRSPTGEWLIRVAQGEKVAFAIRTAAFDADWTVILRPRARFDHQAKGGTDVGQI